MTAIHPSLAPFTVVRVADLEEPLESHTWLIDSLWARAGVGIIGGAPKCCKSWLGLDLALSVASGTPCLGAFHVANPGSVLVYLAEDATATIKQRLAGICRHRSLNLTTLPIDVITAPSIRLDLERDQQRLQRTVQQCRPVLLLLDPFVRLHRVDENDAGHVSSLLAYLRGLQREHNLGVVLVHHTRKNGPLGVQAGQGLRGSGDLHAWGDSNLYLRRKVDQLVLTIEHRAAKAPLPRVLALISREGHHDMHLELADPSEVSAHASASGTQDVDATVLRALEHATAPMSRTQLRATLHLRNKRLGDALSRLSTEGRIVRQGDRWTCA